MIQTFSFGQIERGMATLDSSRSMGQERVGQLLLHDQLALLLHNQVAAQAMVVAGPRHSEAVKLIQDTRSNFGVRAGKH